ncbi:MAG TPA: hypothetical protein VMW66_03600 [Elusimicrobiales bacterium]|nr:hypothetical protein [Elusimicrobiales bacterium]
MKSQKFTNQNPSKFNQPKKRAKYYDIASIIKKNNFQMNKTDRDFYESMDLIYRTLCSILYNYVPLSGHPGGSISSGRMVESLLFDNMDYDFSNPDKEDADIISYAAGHKAMGLYAIWAIRNEMIRIAKPSLLATAKRQMRLEDLLGFRRNPSNNTPLFKKFKSRALDGHPSPETPFVKLSTGASGVGVGSSFGLALGAIDAYPKNTPKVNVIEGEGGLTAGRVHEAIAAAATGQYNNTIMHIDWNQASIDSSQVCADTKGAGQYVQWNPAELFHTHDWNVIYVADGHNFTQVQAAQKLALSLKTAQPTAIIYRTVKGWNYGIEGHKAHGAGHKFDSQDFYATLNEYQKRFKTEFPRYCGQQTPEGIERCFWDNLLTIRRTLTDNKNICKTAADKLTQSKKRLSAQKRKLRSDAPKIEKLYNKSIKVQNIPKQFLHKKGETVTLRGELAGVLSHLNKHTKGAFLATAADLFGSTNIKNVGDGFADGFYNSQTNPKSRLISIGGIAEDAMGAVMTGVSSFGKHIGVTASYAAFIAALEHVAARLHGIGQQGQRDATGKPFNTFIMVNGHAGPKTGEDGPTHADPQGLQLLQDNFPKGISITLTPWDPQEIWYLVTEALLKRPAVIAPFVSRPGEIIIDRKEHKLCPVKETVNGVYPLVKADPKKKRDGTIVLQGNAVATVFVNDVLPKTRDLGYNLNVYYVSSSELFHMLADAKQEKIFPAHLANEAIGITDFTLPVLYRWVRSPLGIKHSLYPFKKGKFLGSGKGNDVLRQAGLGDVGQLKAIKEYIIQLKKLKTKKTISV